MGSHMSWGIIEEEGWRKGPWTSEEDRLLIHYVRTHGEGRWNSVARLSGLKRNGKSCRLRWVNYLRPDLKRGQITPQEENIILELHARWGNRWSTIARSLPGRTDNEIKNYWRTHFKKKERSPSSHHQQHRLLQQQSPSSLDMKGMIALLEENNYNDHKVPSTLLCSMANDLYPTTSESEQGYFYYSMLSNNNASNKELWWDGLWNLDDVHGDFSTTTKASLQNLVAPYC